MGEWKIYEGTDEQIEEMRNAEHGFIYREMCGYESDITRAVEFSDKYALKMHLFWCEVTHYLICDKHQLPDMIERQVRTGQPVWIRYYDEDRGDECVTGRTTTPDCNIPGAEYRFDPF